MFDTQPKFPQGKLKCVAANFLEMVNFPFVQIQPNGPNFAPILLR